MAKKKVHKKLQKKLNGHPFKVGQQYHNRDGRYQVVSIDEPNMVIRYQNGYTIESTIALQERIWENMQAGSDDGLELNLF
ncbi:MAG: hypothetical protein R2867_24875 [Caldilineaceae bacterium]